MSRRRWSPSLVATAVAVGGWGSVLWFLLVSDRASLYLSPRVAWVIPTGAVLLTAFAVAQIAIARTDHPEPLSARSAVLLGFVLLPAVAILILPPAILGAFAADRRSSLTSDSIRAAVIEEAAAIGDAEPGGDAPNLEGFDIGLQFVAAALRSPDAHEALGRLVEMAGPRVTYEGFVTHSEGMPQTEFLLSRFIVACCLADAISAQVPVVGAPVGLLRDQWVRVTGDLKLTDDGAFVSAVRVVKIEQPENPYLWAR